MAFYALEQLMHLHDGYCKHFSVVGHSLLLIQVDGMRYLLSNYCPHQQAPLNRGTLHQHNGGEIRCSRHGMVFNIQTGTTNDGCTNRLQYYPLVYAGNKVGVEL